MDMGFETLEGGVFAARLTIILSAVLITPRYLGIWGVIWSAKQQRLAAMGSRTG